MEVVVVIANYIPIGEVSSPALIQTYDPTYGGTVRTEIDIDQFTIRLAIRTLPAPDQLHIRVR
jgi:hypothetical protein